MAGTLFSAERVYYVDCKLADYTGHDGSSPEKALKTIQQGINKIPDGGTGTVYVASGVYDEGFGRKSDHWWWASRILIRGKSVALKSLEGAEKTHIVGQWDGGGKGFGDGAARCVCVENGDAHTVVIQGFTLRDGATRDVANNPSSRGGALIASINGNEAMLNTYLVDCVISNCIGSSSQLTHGGVLVRCRIENNRFVRPDNNNLNNGVGQIHLFANSRLMNCLFRRNKVIDPATGEKTSDTIYVPKEIRLVNCTFADNASGYWTHSTSYYYNTFDVLTRLPDNDGAKHQNRVRDTAEKRMTMGPARNDLRLRAGCEAATAGDPQYLGDPEIIKLPEIVEGGLPESFRIDPYIDLYGNPIPKTGPIAVGAVQETAVPAGGCYRAMRERFVFGDSEDRAYDGFYQWVWATNASDSVTVRYIPAAGEYLVSLSLSNSGTGESSVRFAPYGTDHIGLMFPPSTGTCVTIDRILTSKRVIVDASNSSDENQDGSEEHPFSRLQDAIDSLGDTTTSATTGLVLVRPGVYGEGGRKYVFSDGTVNTRLHLDRCFVRVVSTDGPEKTVILGGADPSTADGCGEGATMTVAMNQTAAVQGFTLTGGYSGGGETFKGGRGSIYSYGTDLHVTDCIITNNHGRNYALGTARFERCLIADNYGKSGVTVGAKLISCIVAGNHVEKPDGVLLDDYWYDFPCYVVNSTVVGDGVRNILNKTSPRSKYINTLFVQAGAVPYSADWKGVIAGCVFSGVKNSVGSGAVSADPMLYNPAGTVPEDMRVHARSVACSAAVSAGNDPTGVWWYLCPLDFNGDVWRTDDTGRPVAGALQETFSARDYFGSAPGGIVIEGADIGCNDLADGDTVTVSLVPGGARPISGLRVNGADVFFADGDQKVTVTKKAGEDLTVVPMMSDEWFVSSEKGSDGNSGYNPGSPFKTLAHALTNSALSGGDTVKVLPGLYDEGVMRQSESAVLASRAVVRSGIRLVSTDGPDSTFIRGMASDVDDISLGSSYDAHMSGLGRNAVRGLFVDAGGYASGFTLTNGFTRGSTDEGRADHGGWDYNGGNVAGYGTIENCVLTGGKAHRGGGAFKTKCINSIFDGNTAIYGGGASSDAYHYGCISRNNVCTYPAGKYRAGFFYWYTCDNCTAIDSFPEPQSVAHVAKNALILGPMGPWEGRTIAASNFHHCVMAKDAEGHYTSIYHSTVAQGEGCITAALSALPVDEDGRPVAGVNPAVDAADAAVSANIGEYDLSGVQRVYNGCIDVGALEADWRPRYAKDISGNSAFTVVSASPSAVENEAGKVRLENGSELEAEWEPAGRRRSVRVAVTGSGTLTVALGGDVRTVTEADGLSELKFPRVNGSTELSFTYEGDGFADILRAKYDGMTTLLVR